ncbi:hypothetical protein Ahy_A03g011685 isoform A [Arachis hypogaea]|uniref:Uncharacterized protein n=1 Tax=Arachis hypogaea TaxID=3818 RepID=A0A445DRF3_ARAHY|nr:hypothetical protein Ahy_A03g011685 isoform A [Arachis hypogaea]
MAACHVSPVIFRTMDIMKLQILAPPENLSRMNTMRIGDRPLWFRPFTIVKVGEINFGSGLVKDDTLAEKKRELYQAVEAARISESTPEPTLELDKFEHWSFDSKMESKAVNVVEFSAKELSLFSGQLNIEASFKIASTTVKALPSCLTNLNLFL